MLRFVLPLLAMGGAVACTVVDGDRILGADLARADARFATVPPGLLVGFSPVPGARRIVAMEHLINLSRQYVISTDGITPLCFERPTELLDEARLRPVLEQALDPGTKLEILDFSRYPIPRGELVFSASDLLRPPASEPEAAVNWHGRVRYDARHTELVWAKVRLRKLERWVETTTSVPAHQKIEPGQVMEKSGWRFPFAREPVRDPREAVGKQIPRSVAPGQVLFPAMLSPPNDVERGDVVEVEVASGGVSLRFSGYAETGGHRNDSVLVSAADTGRRFQARVEEKGKVLIHADVQRKKPEVGVARSGGARNPVTAGGGRDTKKDSAEGTGIGAGQVSR
jgi:flagella basal body P-ring formation protein FlgA